MFSVVTIKDKERFLVLFTQDDCSKSKSLLETLGGGHQQVDSKEELLEILLKDDSILIPLFDFTGSFAGVRRNFRFVRRVGKAQFPAWIPQNVQAGIRVYSASTPITGLSLQQFKNWVGLPPRPAKPNRWERASRRSDRHGGLWA